MKTHVPFRGWFRMWLRKRDWSKPWEPPFPHADYRRRIAGALARHLAAGGIVREVRFDPRNHCDWVLGTNCFAEPWRSDPAYLGEHIASRFLGFGFPLQLLPEHENRPESLGLRESYKPDMAGAMDQLSAE